MRNYFKVIFCMFFCLISYLCSCNPAQKSSGNEVKALIEVIDKWVENANKKDYKAMLNMLTDDYYLFQNGRRYNKVETIQMIRSIGIRDITYKPGNIKSGFGGDIAFLTFDVVVNCKINGNATEGKAMEVYIFRKENDMWKMQAKSVVMRDDTSK